MTRTLQLFFSILFLECVLACSGYDKGVILDVAEECMETHPDSVIRMLEKMVDSSFDFDYQRAKFALLWTQARHKCHLPLGDDSLINVAVDYFTRYDKSRYAARSLLYKGLVHKQRKEVEQATEAFARSEQWFEGVEDNQYKALLYNHYGMLVYAQGNYKDALELLKKSYGFKLKGDSVHYVVSACVMIANTYELLDNLDSAKVYFERGLQYKDKISSRRYYLYVKDYADFLRKNKEYAKAELMLLECEQHITDNQKYSLYSCLATLYYDTGEYHKVLEYAEKMQSSGDSLMLRGCYLHLYRAYNKLGKDKDASTYRELYLKYESDISERLKFREISVIPYQVRTEVLLEENHKGKLVRWTLVVCMVSLLSLGIYGNLFVRRRNRRREFSLQADLMNEKLQHEKEIQEHEKDKRAYAEDVVAYKAELEKKEQDNKDLQSLMNWEVGRMQEYIDRKDSRIEKMEEDLKGKKEDIKEKNKEIDRLKESNSAIKQIRQSLEKDLEASRKGVRELQAVADRVEHDKQTDSQIMHYRMSGKVDNIEELLIQLKYGNKYMGRQIPEHEIIPMLKTLLEAEYPGTCNLIDTSVTNATKRVICYLLALGFDDEEMMFRASGKKLETIQRYRKECLMVVNSFSAS